MTTSQQPDTPPPLEGEGEELYVGYLPSAPPRVARFLRRLVPGLFLLALGLAVGLPLLQQPFDPGSFDLGQMAIYQGALRADPYPFLLTGSDSYPLVAPGKHGARRLVAPNAGETARIEAVRITAPLGTMLELESLPLAAAGEPAAAADPAAGRGEPLGRHRLRGQIVDSKCYLGVMKPGRGKPHRSCAARCIAGGIPPMLLVEEPDRPPRVLLLTGADGRALAGELVPYVGELLEIEGEVVRRAGWLFLAADPERYRRVNG